MEDISESLTWCNLHSHNYREATILSAMITDIEETFNTENTVIVILSKIS